MNARRVVEEVLVPMTIVAAPPATVTQRNCLEHFGIAPRDFLRFVAEGAFPVTIKGKLRVASYVDVLRYLTDDAKVRAKRARSAPIEPKKSAPVDPVDALDSEAALRKLGFRPRR